MRSAVLLPTVLVLLCSEAHALLALRPQPEAVGLRIDPEDPAHIFVLVEVPNGLRDHGDRCIALESHDGGQTFSREGVEDIPDSFVSSLSAGEVRYAWTPRMVLSSNDGGRTWEQTGYEAHIDDIMHDHQQRREAAYLAQYGGRVPRRSPYWRPTFGVLCFAYLGAAFFLLFKAGCLRSLVSVVKSGVVLVVAALGLSFVMRMRHVLVGWEMPPELPLTVTMYVAARPLALLAAFVLSALFFPSTIDIARVRTKSAPMKRDWRFDLWELVAICFWVAVLYNCAHAALYLV